MLPAEPLVPGPTWRQALAQKARAYFDIFRNHPRRNIIAAGFTGGLIVLIIAGKLIVGGIAFFTPQTNYVPIYTLVNDSISQHGAIIINVPKGVGKAGAAARVTFEPAIEGEWVDSQIDDAIVFKPVELAIGKHYAVAFKTDDGTISKDFFVVDDPKVDQIFPAAEAEADRHSTITIVFNRPMVPLTTLNELESKDIHVTITPATPGKFKWITTRTLQFIPKAALWGSAHYKVEVEDGFVSMDGLAVPKLTHDFTTKALRLDHKTGDTIRYSDPIQFYFNQPVDLERTRGAIRVTNNTENRAIPFDAVYGTRQVWDDVSNKMVEVRDPSSISITPQTSANGHTRAWEFSSSYSVTIDKVYPVGGDIILDSKGFGSAISTIVTTTSALEDVQVQSERTYLASQSLFDPSGTVTLSFYEDIDKGKSDISVKGLKKLEYGKRCAETEDDASGEECKKVDDHSKLIFTFNPNAFARGEKVSLTLEKLVNDAGYRVNRDPIIVDLTVYPALKVLKTQPESGAGTASISQLVVCTNSPLKAQEGTEFYQNFKASKYIVFGRWDNAYIESNQSYQGKVCASGEYVNRINYGLLPLQSYSLSAHVADVFDQAATINLSLQTEAAPQFYLRFQNLQHIYNVTTPAHTTLTYATENFDYVDVFICKVTPEQMLRQLAKGPSTDTTEGNGTLSCETSASNTIQLKPDRWVNQFFQLNIRDYFADPRGQYVLSFTHPQYLDSQGRQLYARTYLSVTNLSVIANRVDWTSYDYLPDVPRVSALDARGSVYWITRIGSMEAIPAASVSVFSYSDAHKQEKPLSFARTAATNAEGFVEFPLIPDIAGATIITGDESAVVSEWADTINRGGWANAQDEKVYIYTDRPIYRPGQSVHIKGLYRVNFDGIFKIFRDNDVTIKVLDTRGKTIVEQKVPVSAYGTFSTDLTLPTDAALGSYQILARRQSATFYVEEYVGAAFESIVTSDKDEYIAGDTVSVSVANKYYFGVVLDAGELNYTLTSQNFYFDRYSDEYFNFGAGWYDCYSCGYGDTYLKSGKVALGIDGTAKIEIPLDFNTLFKGDDRDHSKLFVLHGTVKDKQGKSVSFQKSFIVHRGEVYLGIKAVPSFVGEKDPFSLRVKTVDVNGKPVSAQAVTIVINKVSWDSYKRQEVDGGFYNRPERTLTPVITKHVSTSLSGDYTERISLDAPGEYQVDATVLDGRGNTIKSTTELYVYGSGNVNVRPTNNATLDLKAETTDVKVGDTASFIIQNPFAHAKALISTVRGRIFSYEVVDLNQSIYRYQFPVNENYIPNVYASVLLLSPDPAVKFGQVEFNVNRMQKALTVDVQTDKHAYLPGEKVHLTITTTDALGRATPADVSVAVADLSVLALKGNPKKDPIVFFYDGFPLTVTTEANIKNLLEETPIPTGTKGGDGGAPADLATKKRGEFKDTAFWQAEVITDASGVAHVSFTLPDNLTKWQIESVGITKDTRLGVNYKEILSQKEVMTVPLSPRFVVPGDEFMIGAKIFNQTTAAQTLSISLTSATLALHDDGKVRKTIQPGETTTVYFSVTAPLSLQEGVHAFTLSAKNDSYDDTVEIAIPITRNMTYESTATAGSSQLPTLNEYLYVPDNIIQDRGGLTVKTSATLASYLTDAIKYLFQYPYGCSEQLASKLSAIAITKRALAVPNVGDTFTLPKVQFGDTLYTADEAVAIGLQQMYDNQNTDGGFAYYKGLESDPYLTIHVANTLADLKAAGYSIRPQVISSSAKYLNGQVAFFTSHKSDTDSLIQLAYAIERTSGAVPEGLLSTIQDRSSTGYLSDKASSDTLARLATLTAGGGFSASFKQKVYATLTNRVDIDSRGAYLKPNAENIGWAYYERPETDTALLIKALVADKREFVEMPNLIRWLLASRASDGSWGSTNTTVVALDALTDYLLWTHETESNFALEALLDGTAIDSRAFGKDNILATYQTFLPVSKIATGKVHTVTFSKENKNEKPNTFYYDMSLKYYLPVDRIAPRDEGIAVMREFYALSDTARLHPLTKAKLGEVVQGVVTVISPKERHLFSLEDYIPAGFELVNVNLSTEDQTNVTEEYALSTSTEQRAPQSPGFLARIAHSLLASVGILSAATPEELIVEPIVYQKLYPDFQELHDDRLMLFIQNLSPGTYTYEYYVRATTPGTFSHLPAVAQEMYFPENFGRTSGSVFTVEQ